MTAQRPLIQVYKVLNEPLTFTAQTSSQILEPLVKIAAESVSCSDSDVQKAEELVCLSYGLPTLLASVIERLTELLEQADSWENALTCVETGRLHPLALLTEVSQVSSTMQEFDIEQLKMKVMITFQSNARILQTSLLSYSLLFIILPLYTRLENAVAHYSSYFCTDEGMSIEYHDTICSAQLCPSPLKPIRSPSVGLLLNAAGDNIVASKLFEEGQSRLSILDTCDSRTVDDEECIKQRSIDDSALPATDRELSNHRSSEQDAISFEQQVTDFIMLLSSKECKKASPPPKSTPLRPVTKRERHCSNTVTEEIVDAGWYRLLTAAGLQRDLFCRIVGSIVMVRVGGGWLELAAFLESWSAHHALTQLSMHCTTNTIEKPAIAKLCRNQDGKFGITRWHMLKMRS